MPLSPQIAPFAKPTTRHRSPIPARGARARDASGSWLSLSSWRLLRFLRWWQFSTFCCRRTLRRRKRGASAAGYFEPFPFQALKIVVVVWQILTQVCYVQNEFWHSVYASTIEPEYADWWRNIGIEDRVCGRHVPMHRFRCTLLLS